MKAILVNGNKDLVWSEVPDPVVKDDEVLIKIYAAALNRADLLQRQGISITISMARKVTAVHCFWMKHTPWPMIRSTW